MDTQQEPFFAEIEVAEFGEPVRYRTIGPIWTETEDEARTNLEERGDTVLRIWQGER